MWLLSRSINNRSDTFSEVDSGKTLEYGVSTFYFFIDFKAAYETLNREKLLKVMKKKIKLCSHTTAKH
jgi:hypothetical protein